MLPLSNDIHPPVFTMLLALGFGFTVFSKLVASRSPFDVSEAEWNVLNTTVGGRLGRGVPHSRACFSLVGTNVTGSESQAECASIQQGYGTDSK